MTLVEQLAAFVTRASYSDLSETAREQLKIRVLDSLGCAVGALDGEPLRMIREHLDDFGGTGHSTLIGGGPALVLRVPSGPTHPYGILSRKSSNSLRRAIGERLVALIHQVQTHTQGVPL